MDPQQGPPNDVLIGQTIGNYLVTQKLGEGGMGSVYLAEHPTIGKKVALKVLHAEFAANQEVTKRFFNEAKAVNDIGHPNIVDIIDFGILQTGGAQLVYFIMEYLAGATLTQLVRTEAPMPPERAFAIALQVADALSSSHRSGIVHRDLKPDNIILVSRGRDRDFVKLLDFGIAKLSGDASSSRTRTGIVMGTPAYMSPEQCEGRANLDLRTDIYALGIVLYEMLTGRVPFIGEGYGEILVQHLAHRPLPPSQYRMLPPHVEAVVLKALEKRPEMRYPNMDEFIRAMSDPTGYVEAHGGIAGFMASQLMPSTAPLPNVRTPGPMMTPPPGSLSTGYPSQHGVPPGSLHDASGRIGTPVPTTLGGAAGQQPTGQIPAQGKSKAGLIAAAIGVVVVAGIAIAVVASKGKSGDAGGGGSGSSQEMAVTPGSGDHTIEHAPDAAVAVVPPVSVDAAVAVVPPVSVDAAVAVVPIDAAVVAPPVAATVKVSITSEPAGAEIFVDGIDQNKVTPATLELPKKAGGKAKIALKLKSFVDSKFAPIDLGADSDQKITMRKVGPVVRPPGPGNTTHGHGSNGDPDGLERPD